MTYTCRDCHNLKPESDFYMKDGRPTPFSGPRCKNCTAIKRDEQKKHRIEKKQGTPATPATPSQGKPKTPQGEQRTLVRNSCGHDYYYRIRSERTLDWLKTVECPNCQREHKGEDGSTPPPPVPQPTPTPTPEPEPEPTPEPEPEIEADEEWVQAALARLPEAMYHSQLPDLIALVEAGVPVWMQGPPGTSKSFLSKQVAQALGLNFYPQQCHEAMTESRLFGYVDAVGQVHRTPMWDAFENGGVFVLDEVDNGNPNLLAGLNSAISNGYCVFGSGTVVEKHPDFRVIATANTAGLGPEAGFIGRMGVDLATRDRFVTVMVGIDDMLEDGLAVLVTGGDVAPLFDAFKDRAEKVIRTRSVNMQKATDTMETVKVVRRVRQLVDRRFKGVVVSPRAAMHVSQMVAMGFDTLDALEAKLPGLKTDEVVQVWEEANTNRR